jgi:hypothetical protein
MRWEGVASMEARLRVARPRIPEAIRSEDDILIYAGVFRLAEGNVGAG